MKTFYTENWLFSYDVISNIYQIECKKIIAETRLGFISSFGELPALHPCYVFFHPQNLRHQQKSKTKLLSKFACLPIAIPQVPLFYVIRLKGKMLFA